MIMSRTPYRISLFGGGTDYPAWYRQYGGAVIGTAINKYCYISIRQLPPFFEHKHRIVYSSIELTKTVNDIRHPSVRSVLSELGVDTGVEIQHCGDLPARSGLGSSSSFTVGLINAVRAFQGQISSPRLLAQEAIRIEQEVIKETVGSQDQVWAAFGGTNVVKFRPNGNFSVQPMILPAGREAELRSHLMLFFTGISRTAETIASQKLQNLDRRRQQLLRMREMVDAAASILQDSRESIAQIGRMLRDAWTLKKELAEAVSNPTIDSIYEAATAAGAVGGKILGAGGGGFMLIFAEPGRQRSVRMALRKLIEVSFRIGGQGSTIVIYEPDGSALDELLPDMEGATTSQDHWPRLLTTSA